MHTFQILNTNIKPRVLTCLRCIGIYGFACFVGHHATLAVQQQCLPTNFIPFTIFVLFYRIVAIFKYSGYSETVKLGGVRIL